MREGPYHVARDEGGFKGTLRLVLRLHLSLNALAGRLAALIGHVLFQRRGLA